MSRRLSVAALSALLLVLPFEPRRPTLPVFGFEVTLLEAGAGIAIVLLLYACRERLGGVLRRPSLPLAFLWSYVAAQLLSAAVAPMNRGLALKFALRMAAAAVFALAVAATPREVVRRSMPVLTLACAVVAVLAVLEGLGVAALDPFLDPFRPGPFWIGLSRRASAASENPNLAAAMLVYGLVPAVGLASLRRRPAPLVLFLSALFSLGLLFTYSRGGLAAMAVALAVLGLVLSWRGLFRAPAAALLTLLAVAAAFTVGARSASRLPYPKTDIPAHAARYAPGETFLSMGPGESRTVPVAITNIGRRPWGAAVLGCSWQRAAEAERAMDWAATARCPVTPVPAAASGQTVDVGVVVRAPAGEGRYLLVLDLVADGWVMSSAGVPPATFPTAVSRDPAAAPPFSFVLPPGAWQRGRATLWRAALAMWRERPLTGIGPDNFRWAHAAYAGWPSGGAQDTLIPANNLFLEAAATTGTLGLIALVGTLAATVRAGWHQLARAPAGSVEAVCPAVLLALAAAIAVHGMVDSLLGFTAHYLFLGLVVGAASHSLDSATRTRGE